MSQDKSRLNIALDLPAHDGYLPTYEPGQCIKGKLKVQLDTPTRVLHLRIALYGSVQVCGREPGRPLHGGLFDYQKNVRLINRAIRILKRSGAEQNLETVNEFQYSTIHDDQKRQSLSLEPPQKKGRQERKTEELIRWIAEIESDKDKAQGVLVDKDQINRHTSDKSRAFDLDASTHSVNFSIRIPTSKRLPGTFDHPNYPIGYRLVAIMACSDHQEESTLCYSTVKVCLEHSVYAEPNEFCSPVQSPPTKILVTDGLLKGIYSYLLSSWPYPMPPKTDSPPASHLQACLEMPTQTFARSELVRFRVRLFNTASNLKISRLSVKTQLSQKILMTCGFNEVMEHKVLVTKNVSFGTPATPLSLDGAHMSFDLSRILRVPENARCSILSSSTRDVFSLVYHINVDLEVEGRVSQKEDPSKIDLAEVVYLANQDNLSDSLISSHVAQKGRKLYRLELDPLPIIVGH